jgi:hypothetical protein
MYVINGAAVIYKFIKFCLFLIAGFYSLRFFVMIQDECMMPSHRTWAAFILACIVHNFRLGQQEAEQSNLVTARLGVNVEIIKIFSQKNDSFCRNILQYFV